MHKSNEFSFGDSGNVLYIADNCNSSSSCGSNLGDFEGYELPFDFQKGTDEAYSYLGGS